MITTPTPNGAEFYYQVPATLFDQLSKCEPKRTVGTHYSIGIGITTRNRREVFNTTLAKIIEFLPQGARIVVVDDASTERIDLSHLDVPVRQCRFNENVGIARAKNRCLEMLQDCEHIFLFDDDTYPLKAGWEQGYMQSGMNHLMYIFETFANGQQCGDIRKIYENNSIAAYSHVRGCMLYYRKICLQKAGGMDVFFGKWGHEHGDLSNRIYNFGLTPFRYMDISGSKGLFYAGDEHRKVTSTVPDSNRAKLLMETESHYVDQYNKAIYREFRHQPTTTPLILSSYFTETVDPQRGIKWQYDEHKVAPLVKSTKKLQLDLTMLVDFELDSASVDSPHTDIFKGNINPYFKRWLAYYDHLVKYGDIFSWVFCVDATDVEVINLPAPEPGKIYVGDEDSVVANEWMTNHHKSSNFYYNKLYTEFGQKQLYNAGILGGYVDDVKKFLRALIDRYTAMVSTNRDLGITDMALFNSICYDSEVAPYIVSGRQVNTEFKADKRNGYSWFKHK